MAAPLPPKLTEPGASQKTAAQSAWACLLTNLVLPGLGTLVAQRRLVGWLQLIISQTGFALSVLWAVLYLRECAQQGGLPEEVAPFLAVGLLGCLLFFFAWIWSLASSFAILLAARKRH